MAVEASQKELSSSLPDKGIFSYQPKVKINSSFGGQFVGEAQNRAAEPETMVQVFMVVRCYSCEAFQVHQVSSLTLQLGMDVGMISPFCR